jgi:6-pyruvoyl-tetrahydropterin synthase
MLRRSSSVRPIPRLSVSPTHAPPVTASHHLSSPRLSPEQAHALYGGAALLHGHAYGIKVTMKGTLDAGVGGLVGGDLMEDVVALAVSEQLDTKNLVSRFRCVRGL